MVTGASSGIGAAVARALAHEGMHLALAARRESALVDVQAGLEGRGGEARSLVAATDVTYRQQVKSLVARAEEELGPVDVLVNCAGVVYYTLVLFPKYTTPWAKVPRPPSRRCARGALRANSSRLEFLKARRREASASAPLDIEQLTRNEQVSGSSPLVGSFESGLSMSNTP